MKKTFPNLLQLFICVLAVTAFSFSPANAQQQAKEPALEPLQQDFVNLGFGMFIHYGMPTFMDQDWSDPNAPLALFDSPQLNADQWAKAAKSAHMTYGCLTTKHHSGFPIWDTKTTDYNVMNTPLARDVVKEYTEAFRKNGLKVMLYYSILDTHQGVRPNQITTEKVDMIKQQLTELLTNYGEITALIIDGWDAPWSRISYDEVPFNDIYHLIKTLQPNCMVMDLNAAKYPSEALFYTDIKSYEQGAGQYISKEQNKLPALACLPLQANWFWKESFPSTAVKDPSMLVNDILLPYNQVYCNFILNVAPNKDGLIDDNALSALKEIGKLYPGPTNMPTIPPHERPIIASNVAKFARSDASWSNDMNLMDFANDDRFSSAWVSNPEVKEPWYEIIFERAKPFNAIVITESKPNISSYVLEAYMNGKWVPIAEGNQLGRVKIHRFDRIWAEKIRMRMTKFQEPPSLAEFGVYDEQ